MRTRQEIEKLHRPLWEGRLETNVAVNTEITVELLLDIRDYLETITNNQSK